MTDLREIILTVPVFLFAISFHEYAHAFTAVALGDPTPRLQGRLTLNFMAHFSWLGALMLLVAGIGWAKPVQVRAENMRNPHTGMFWVALAGPVANLVLAIVFAVLLRFTAPYLAGTVGQAVIMLLYVGVHLNLLLAFFNLIPLPPLDGARVLAPVLPRRWVYLLANLEPWGFIVIYVLFRYVGLGQLLFRITETALRFLLA